MEKSFFLLIAASLLIMSCSKEDNKQGEELISCFEISKNTVEIGEVIQLTNCSVGAVTYQYDFGNGEESTLDSPSIFYENSGEYQITLEITSGNGETKTTQKNITVNAIENNYLYPSFSQGDSFIPINFDIKGDKFYYIENFQNIFDNTPDRYNYVEFDLSNSFSRIFIADRTYNSGNAFLHTLADNNQYFYAVRSLSNHIGLTEVKLNANWETTQTGEYTWRVFYGMLEDDTNFLYYGAYRNQNVDDPDYSLYKSPSIEIRDDLGNLLERKTYDQIEQGFIGDLIKIENGFMAFGGITDPIDSETFSNYRPMIIFLDNQYGYVNHVIYDNTVIAATNYNDLNGTFHIEKLPNNNYVLYSHNEFRIINIEGEELDKKEVGGNQDDVQALLTLSDGFLISTKDYLKKYSLDGALLKSIFFGGRLTPNFILKDNQIFFVSGYDSSYNQNGGNYSVLKTFVGAVDTNLNIINLN